MQKGVDRSPLAIIGISKKDIMCTLMQPYSVELHHKAAILRFNSCYEVNYLPLFNT